MRKLLFVLLLSLTNVGLAVEPDHCAAVKIMVTQITEMNNVIIRYIGNEGILSNSVEQRQLQRDNLLYLAQQDNARYHCNLQWENGKPL